METSDVPDAFNRNCPSHALLARLAEKWSMLAIVALEEGPRRFGALQRRIDGVSQKMLTQTLRKLERDDVIRRTAFEEPPLRVEYALTPRGESLLPLIAAIKLWTEQNWVDVA